MSAANFIAKVLEHLSVSNGVRGGRETMEIKVFRISATLVPGPRCGNAYLALIQQIVRSEIERV